VKGSVAAWDAAGSSASTVVMSLMLHFSIVSSNSGNTSVGSLTPRSIVLSLLLGSHPPELPVASLVRFCGLFEIAPGTVRTALSRMVERGELVAADGSYQLSGRLLTRQTEQDTGRRRAAVDWDGSWHVAVVASERRTVTERREFRARALGSKLGELRPDIWMRPANLALPSDLPGCIVTRGPLSGTEPDHLVRQLWAVDDIDRDSELRRRGLDRVADELGRRGPGAMPDAFEALAMALRQLRIEPQLPGELHSPAAGDQLRERYGEVERAFRHELQTFLTASA
jgi:phenylacetic acid degradation operon negative regulatory protein